MCMLCYNHPIDEKEYHKPKANFAMPVSQIDFLIIGQGLAGSILAFELIARGQQVMVIDNNHQGSASHVAAGIINPITGHRLNLTDGFVNYYARATQFYSDLEQVTGVSTIKTVEQIRLLKNPGQADYFDKRLQQTDYKAFLEVNSNASLFTDVEHGTAKVKQTSIIDTKLLLAQIRNWLKNADSYLNAPLDYAQLHFAKDSVGYGDISAHGVIFCEGYQAINNPWLKDLPFKLAKGEILTIETLNATQPMLSWGNWLTPHNNNTAKLGSNYAWQNTDLTPSKSVREKLLDSLETQTGQRPSVVKHEVGIRPTTKHRHAFVGKINNLNHGYCFNGFGSKGCLTIPAHADLLCDHLINNTPLPEDICKWL